MAPVSMNALRERKLQANQAAVDKSLTRFSAQRSARKGNGR